jgi:hypothetical protein
VRGQRLRLRLGLPLPAGRADGHAWPTPLIQLLATSEDQVDNVYRPLQAMARNPRLSNRMLVREGFIRLRDEDGDPEQNRIDVVTSSALSRLGNPITFAMQDETQLYTTTNKLVSVARTQREARPRWVAGPARPRTASTRRRTRRRSRRTSRPRRTSSSSTSRRRPT